MHQLAAVPRTPFLTYHRGLSQPRGCGRACLGSRSLYLHSTAGAPSTMLVAAATAWPDGRLEQDTVGAKQITAPKVYETQNSPLTNADPIKLQVAELQDHRSTCRQQSRLLTARIRDHLGKFATTSARWCSQCLLQPSRFCDWNRPRLA